MIEDETPSTANQFSSHQRATDVSIHQHGTKVQSPEPVSAFARLLDEVHGRYGAPGPETEGEARERAETFIASHHAWGDLVFEKRVALSLITDDQLIALHGEVVALFNAIASESGSIAQTSSCTIGDDKRYVFSVRPPRERSLFRKDRSGTRFVQLAGAAGFTQIEPNRP